MNHDIDLDITLPARRDFLRVVTHSGGALIVGTLLPTLGPRTGQASAADAPALAADPLAFIRIAPDNTVTLISKHLEMGQGVTTGLATLVADELGADWAQMRYEFAPAEMPRYRNLAFGIQGTGGSSSMFESWPQLRLAAAACRQMLITAAAAQWQLPAADITIEHGVVRHAPSGRHATVGAMAAAAAKLPVPASVTLKPASQFTLIGKSAQPRIDGAGKTNGSAIFGLDVRRPGMVRAMIARSPRAGGKLKSFDANAALKIKGVLAVHEVPTGVAVIAVDTWSAMKGREALQIEWDDSAAETRSSSQIVADYRALAANPGALIATHGDVDKALKDAARVVEAEYAVPYLAHAPMEPLNLIVELHEDSADLWGAFQLPTVDQGSVAAALGFKPEKVRLHIVLAGGSFGRRANSDYIVEAVSVAKAWGGKAPVQLVWTRTDDLQSGYYRPLFFHRLRAGLDSAGKLIAWDHRIVGPSILTGTAMAAFVRNGIDPLSVDGADPLFYAVANSRVDLHTPPSKTRVLTWRSVGHSHSGFAMESFIDELAQAAGKDPLEFRLALLADRPDLTRLLQLVADKAGWHQPLPAGRTRGIAIREAFNSRVAQVAEITVAKDGSFTVDRVVCAIDCGTAINPQMIEAQLQGGIGFGLGAALQGAITLTDGKVDQTNFDGYLPLRLSQMPRVEVHIMPSSAPPSGVGELGVPAIAPAVANALAAAGRRVRTLPLQVSG